MHRRDLIQTGLAAAATGALGACATRPPQDPNYPIRSDQTAPAYTADELGAAKDEEFHLLAAVMRFLISMALVTGCAR